MAWNHPTGQAPKTVVIVCAGYTNRDWHKLRGVYDSPLNMEGVEVWSLNKALRSHRVDMGFMLDDFIGEYRRDPAYVKELDALKIPIITSSVDMEVKKVLSEWSDGLEWSTWYEYPIFELRDRLGAAFGAAYLKGSEHELTKDNVPRFGNQLMYLKNSVPLILAYAWMIGVKTVYLFGVDYTHPMAPVREADQPCAEFWVGWLYGQGVQVVLSDDTTLLSRRDGQAIYGYGARQPKLRG